MNTSNGYQSFLAAPVALCGTAVCCGIKVLNSLFYFFLFLPQQIPFSPSATNNVLIAKAKFNSLGCRHDKAKEEGRTVKLDARGHTNMFGATGGRRDSEIVFCENWAGRQQEC